VTRLAAESVTLGFPERVLRQGVDLEVRPGECWAVLGNNGSGKTTLLHALAGLRPALSGRVLLDGVELPQVAHAARARKIGLLLQEETAAFWGTLLEYVLLGRYPHRRWMLGADAADEALARAALERVDLAGREARMLSTLSGGERQRARLALILTQDPEVYLLDEPLQHLDLRHQLETLGLLHSLAQQRGKAVVMVLHEPARARRFCDRALLLFEDGHSQAGPADELLAREVLERLYGCPVEGT
jgi:iron complex transport system ATP-binding protein